MKGKKPKASRAAVNQNAIVRRARVLTWSAIAVLGVVARLRTSLARAIAFTFVGSVGIAHGATDVDILSRIGIAAPGGRSTLALAYGTLAVTTFVAARRVPKLAGRALLGLSLWHFGSADVAFARACGSRVRGKRESFVRGTMPLFISGTDRRSAAAATLAFARAARHAREGEFADALDLVLPATLLLAAPARLGFAIYFGAWHSVRHTALVLERDARPGRESQRALRFARESAPNVLIAALAGAIAYALERRKMPADVVATTGNDKSRADLFGALILAITVPHQIAVTLFERHATARE